MEQNINYVFVHKQDLMHLFGNHMFPVLQGKGHAECKGFGLWQAGYSPTTPSTSGFFLKFSRFLSQVIPQLVR